MEWLYPAYIVGAMFASAMVSKSLGVCVAFSIGLTMVYPDATKATFLFLFFAPAVVLAAFRD
jgi:hypothetical protein